MTRSTRRCTAEARCLPAREGEAGLQFSGTRTAGIDKDPVQLSQCAKRSDQIRPSVGEQIAAGHRKARRAVRQNGRAGIPRAGAPRDHHRHRDHAGQEASEERDDEIQARRKQQDRSVAFLSALGQAHSHRAGARIELGKRQGKPLGRRGPAKKCRPGRSAAPPPDVGARQPGTKTRLRAAASACDDNSAPFHRPARVAKCRASSPIVGCSNSRSGVSSNPSHSSSSTIKNTEFAEFEPQPGERHLRVDRVVRQVERACQVLHAPVSDRGFARIFRPQNKLPLMTPCGRRLP